MIRALCVAVLVALSPAALAQSDRSAEELRAEMMFWDSIRTSSDPADFRAYLEQYPNGKFAALARIRRVEHPGDGRLADARWAAFPGHRAHYNHGSSNQTTRGSFATVKFFADVR